MRGLHEILNCNLTEEELNTEIKERRDLICKMVGNLYPAVLAGEITKILGELHKRDLKYNFP